MLVREMMTPEVTWIDPDMSLKDAAMKMRELDIGALPVGENDRLVGMLTDRDITCRAVAGGVDPSAADVRDTMSKGIIWCFDDSDIEDAAHIMEDKQIRRLPVLDHDKRMVGMLALGDISQKASHELSGEVVEGVCRPRAVKLAR